MMVKLPGNWENIIHSVFALIFISEAVYMGWMYSKNRNKKRKRRLITEVLFFNENSSDCYNHVNSSDFCGVENCSVENLNKVMSYLRSSKRTLDISIYFLTYDPVIKLLKELHMNNINIRIITNSNFNEGDEQEYSQLLLLKKIGMKVRTKKSSCLLHNKFAIIDKKLVISGSANWTIQAFFGNFENIYITNLPNIVNGFVQSFEKIWSQLDPNYEFRQNIEDREKEIEDKKQDLS